MGSKKQTWGLSDLEPKLIANQIWAFIQLESKVSEHNQQYKNEVSCGGSTVKTFNTSNLINHLRREHATDFKDYKEKKKIQELTEKEAAEKNAQKDPKVKGKKQLSLAETEVRVKPWDINDPRTSVSIKR